MQTGLRKKCHYKTTLSEPNREGECGLILPLAAGTAELLQDTEHPWGCPGLPARVEHNLCSTQTPQSTPCLWWVRTRWLQLCYSVSVLCSQNLQKT